MLLFMHMFNCLYVGKETKKEKPNYVTLNINKRSKKIYN